MYVFTGVSVVPVAVREQKQIIMAGLPTTVLVVAESKADVCAI